MFISKIEENFQKNFVSLLFLELELKKNKIKIYIFYVLDQQETTQYVPRSRFTCPFYTCSDTFTVFQLYVAPPLA